MKLLLDNELAPLTFSWGFIEKPLPEVAQVLVEWRRGLNLTMESTPVDGSFRELLLKLPPLCQMHYRELLIATDSNWTAYFDNGQQGGDPGSPVSVVGEKLSSKCLSLHCVPDSYDVRNGRGEYGAVQFALKNKSGISTQRYFRTIAALNDGGKWVFETTGTPQPFEQTERYKARKIRDRFTAEMLEDYCKALGIRLFDESFYGPQGVLVVRTDPLPEWDKYISLEEAQRQLGMKK